MKGALMTKDQTQLQNWLTVETEMIGAELRSGQPFRTVNDRFTRTVEAAVLLAVTSTQPD